MAFYGEYRRIPQKISVQISGNTSILINIFGFTHRINHLSLKGLVNEAFRIIAEAVHAEQQDNQQSAHVDGPAQRERNWAMVLRISILR